MHWTPSNYTSVRTAYSKLINAITIRPTAESIDTKNAIGRVLWTDIISPTDIPSSNCSHMDGFVVKYNDISMISHRGPIKLRVVPGEKIVRAKTKSCSQDKLLGSQLAKFCHVWEIQLFLSNTRSLILKIIQL